MKYIKQAIKLILIIILLSIIFGTLSYFNIINETIVKIIQLSIVFIYILYNSYILGKSKQNKGYLEGFKFGGIIVLSFMILNLFLKKELNISKLVYYFLIILISVSGSILGINKKTKA